MDAKRRVAKSEPGLTWDGFAELAGVHPRPLKAYRMPESSANFRKMPPVAEAAIKALLERVEGKSKAAPAPNADLSQLVPALAALVVRLGRASLIEGRMVAGVSAISGSPVGLRREDRKAMALVSRACLTNGLTDVGAEIHELLWHCTRPFGEWLDIEEVRAKGIVDATFIQAEDGLPTPEAEELAQGFGGLTAGLEEQLFSKFTELLKQKPAALAALDYTATRELVVRNPVVTHEDLRQESKRRRLSAQVSMMVEREFYEPVPEGWRIGDGVPMCAHCSNALRQGEGGLVCRTVACAASNPAKVATHRQARELLRVKRGIRQFWIEPGIDEIRLYDALRSRGMAAELYPHMDRVDIAVDSIGIDLKAYASPEILAEKFNRNLGGLNYYERKWVVVPDWLAETVPGYTDRLRSALKRNDVLCLTVSEALARFDAGEANA